MSIEKKNWTPEKDTIIYNNNNLNVEEKNELKEDMCKNNIDDKVIQSENIIQEDNEQNSIKENIFKDFTSYLINPFYQMLINKIMPSGFKIETEENLLKKEEKRQKGYLHRKHKKIVILY